MAQNRYLNFLIGQRKLKKDYLQDIDIYNLYISYILIYLLSVHKLPNIHLKLHVNKPGCLDIDLF